ISFSSKISRLQIIAYVSVRISGGSSVSGIEEIDPSLIRDEPKDAFHQFAVPDLIAHSIFSAFDRNRNNFKITEARYLAEMMHRFSDENHSNTFLLIQPDRMHDICEPTISLLNDYGHKVG
ncbi:hypothetical protein, partial [uncultured Aliiroseovarius sp.]|uniref:hypothetical protein n=1 Tax=uncultured Aliiroseovarius sp. TaxID=1658783 RepID=UPI0025979C68